MRLKPVMTRHPGVISCGDIFDVSDCEDVAGNGLMSVPEIISVKTATLILAGADGYCVQVSIAPESRVPEKDVGPEDLENIPTTLH